MNTSIYLSNSDFDIQMSWSGYNGAGDHENVLQAKSRHKVGDKVDIASATKAEPCEAQRHEEGAQDGDDSCQSNAKLGVDQVYLVEGVVDIEEEEDESDGVWDVLSSTEHLREVKVDSVGGDIVMVSVQGIHLVQVRLETGDELRLVLSQHHGHTVGQSSLNTREGVIGQ